MNILIACEESQIVCSAMRAAGANAFSCDVRKPSGNLPQFHIMGDVLSIINGDCIFRTMTGDLYELIGSWDMVIAFPPCTYMAVSGSCNLFDCYSNIKDYERYEKMCAAVDFFYSIYNCNAKRLAIENPKPMKICGLPVPSQYVEPYYFGDPYTKKTGLWLRDLPLLVADFVVSPIASWTTIHSTGYRRSKTFPGVARAMVDQWYLRNGQQLFGWCSFEENSNLFFLGSSVGGASLCR